MGRVNIRKWYDAVIIHPEYNTRLTFVQRMKEQSIEVFPIHTLDTLVEFLTGKNFKNERIPQGIRRAKKYYLGSGTILRKLSECYRIGSDNIKEIIIKYHPDARIVNYLSDANAE